MNNDNNSRIQNYLFYHNSSTMVFISQREWYSLNNTFLKVTCTETQQNSLKNIITPSHFVGLSLFRFVPVLFVYSIDCMHYKLNLWEQNAFCSFESQFCSIIISRFRHDHRHYYDFRLSLWETDLFILKCWKYTAMLLNTPGYV